MNILIIGAGYVGISLALIFAEKYTLKILDTDSTKVNQINKNCIVYNDSKSNEYLKNQENLVAFNNINDVDQSDLDFIFIAVPTNFDEKSKTFNTDSIDKILHRLHQNKSSSIIVIKSTVPIGYTLALSKKYSELTIVFSPEFLREGFAIKDNLNPDRIIAGSESSKANEKVLELLSSFALNNDIKQIACKSSEAEAIKLFSNTFLAMRVAYFNELDNFVLENNLDSKTIVEGVSLDKRIGMSHNNPSFGYGGYCLPKDSKQLKSDFGFLSEHLITSIIESNRLRKQYIANKIINIKPKTIGIYKLSMKKNSDNFRESAIVDIIKTLKTELDSDIKIYEPNLKENIFMGIKIEKNLTFFKENSEIIVANRISENLKDVMYKVFSRDVYNKN